MVASCYQLPYGLTTPALPADQLSAINKEHMPGGLKVFIEFSEKFYPDALIPTGLLNGAFNGNHLYYDESYGKDSNKNILGLFAVGEPSEQYTSLVTDKAIINYILEELNGMFNGKASKHYIKNVTQNWNVEPFIRGSYSERKGNTEKMASPVAPKYFYW